MKTKTKKVVLGSAIIILVAGYLTYTGMRDSMVYYLTVSEFLDRKNEFMDKGVRVSGKVVDGSIIRDASSMHVKFEIMDEKFPDKRIKVEYSGIIPDIFKPGITVVVEGKFSAEQIFKATVLLAKCPSKYEEKRGK